MPEVVVVDNASHSDRSGEILDRYPWVYWVSSPINRGWSGGNNLGIEFFLARQDPPESVFLLNNDTVVDSQTIKVLAEAMEQGYDVVGPVINEYSPPDAIQTQGTAFNRADRPSEFFSVIPTPIDEQSVQVTPVDIVNGCAVAIKRQVFDRIGLIDDRFFLICEESDFCLRAQEAGFQIGVVHRTLVWHKHSVSFARAGKPIQRYYGTRNLWLLLKKHPVGGNRKGPLASRLLYFRRCFHLFSHERELGNSPGALAICDAMADALLGRYGKWIERRTWLGTVIHCSFAFCWRIRGGKLQATSVESLGRPSKTSG
jgi:GT2 family glycosyltransferase